MTPLSPRAWSVDRRLLVLLLGLPLIGLLGVTVAEIVPDGRIGYHLVRAEQEGIAGPVERDPSLLDTTTDHYSECVAITVGLGDRPGSNLLERALSSPSYFGCQQMVDKLDVLETTGVLAPGWTYLRYWHGYAVITRPAIGILGLAGARWVGFGLLLLAVVGLGAAVKRSFGGWATTLLLAPALLTSDMVVGGLTLSQAIGMGTAWVGGLMAFGVVTRHPHWRTAALVAALGGAVNAYFDLMSSIPASLALTAIGATLGICATGADPALQETWRVAAAAVVGWTVGLVWMWSSKWLLAAAVLGYDDVVDNVRSQIEFRISGQYDGVSPTRTRGLTDNLAEWWHHPLTPWVVAAVILVLAAAAVRARGTRPPWTGIAVCCAIIAVPVAAWYVVLNNHSQIHAWLVYRSMPMAFGGLVTFVYVALDRARHAAVAAGRHDDTPVALILADPTGTDFTGTSP